MTGSYGSTGDSVGRSGSARPLPLPEPPLRDGDVVLRAWAESDAPVVVAGGLDPLVSRFRYSLPTDAPGATRWLAEVAASRIRGERLELAVLLGDLAVGSVSLTEIAHGNAMIRYWLLADARGRGVGTRAVCLLTAWAFGALNLGRLAAFVEPDNNASQRLLERCSFIREGRLRQHMQGRGGRRVDSLIYGLLPADLGPNEQAPRALGRRSHPRLGCETDAAPPDRIVRGGEAGPWDPRRDPG